MNGLVRNAALRRLVIRKLEGGVDTLQKRL